MFDRSKCGVRTCLRWKLLKARRSCRNWAASASGAGFRVCCERGAMKPLLTLVCLARRRASKSILLTKLSTPSSPFVVSAKQIHTTHFLVIDRYYMDNIMLLFLLAEFDIYLFLVFLAGMLLFLFADSLSR